MKKQILGLFAVSLFFLGVSNVAFGVDLTLDQGRLYTPDLSQGGMGSGRGVGFHADENFSMNSFATKLNVGAAATTPEYRYEIFSSTNGHDVGGLLASTSFFVLEGVGYQLQPFVFDFIAGNYYVINFSRVDGATLDGVGTSYSWEDVGTYVPYDYGVLTLIDGFVGATPGSGNPLIPHVRFSDVISSTTFSVGGSVSGLTGSVTLQNNLTNDLLVNASGGFTFTTELNDGSGYSVSVLSQPSGQTCSVASGSGAITSADVTDVSVTCADDPVTPPEPTAPAAPIPTMSIYGLMLTTLGLLLVATRRLRMSARRK